MLLEHKVPQLMASLETQVSQQVPAPLKSKLQASNGKTDGQMSNGVAPVLVNGNATNGFHHMNGH